MLTLSAPASTTARASSSDRIPPPTVERNEELSRDRANGVDERAASLERGRDVEHDELVDAFRVVARGQLGGIAGAAQVRRSSRP